MTHNEEEMNNNQEILINSKGCIAKCVPQTFSLHAHCQALLVAAVLAAVTLSLVDNAVLLISAGILKLFAHSTLEESFATFTTVRHTGRHQNTQ